MRPNYPGTKFLVAALKARNRMETFSLRVHYNSPEILNLVISRCCFKEEGKEMYQNL